jgi:hypothetical protein
MTPEEIRANQSNESELGQERAYWLREIAAQLAELNQTFARIDHKMTECSSNGCFDVTLRDR